MTDITDWPGHPDADPDCECCLGDGLQADGETPCPCIDARNEPLAAQVASLTPDDLIDLIGEFGREVYHLLDDCETSGPVGEEIHTITEDGLRKVSAILDRIEAMPFEEPGVMLGTGAMLQAAIMQTFAHPPQPSASVVEAMKHLHDIINCGNCSWSRQSARLALRALKGGDATQTAQEAVPVDLTYQQKLEALSLRFYQGMLWTPKAGDYYTTSRADLELYRVVAVEGGMVKTQYCDQSKSSAVSSWPEKEFTSEGFGPKRVWVPDFVLSAHPPQPSASVVAVERAFDKIRELNMSGRDENGHRWANSDLIDQTVTEGLVALRALKGGA